MLPWFFDLMKSRLEEKAHKDDTHKEYSHWLLFEKLHYKIEKLENAIEKDDYKQIEKDCADIANYAMFLAEKNRMEKKDAIH